MENLSIKSQSKETKKHLELYVKNEITKYKFLLAEHLSKSFSLVVAALIVGFIAILAIILFSIAAGLFLGQQLNNYALAFLIICGVYILVAVLISSFRKQLFGLPIFRTLIKEL